MLVQRLLLCLLRSAALIEGDKCQVVQLILVNSSLPSQRIPSRHYKHKLVLSIWHHLQQHPLSVAARHTRMRQAKHACNAA